MVVTGSEKAFAAGADIKEMEEAGFAQVYGANFFAGWERFTATRKPIVAAVAGYALGGGCEVAMMCDFIIAADTAKFGQPEIKLGVGPGMGGSQRLTRAVGKAKAMEMCLTGRMMDAVEAERAGLVARIVPAAELIDEALRTAAAIAAMPPLATIANKEMVNAAFETGLAQGILFERRLFNGLFATEDKAEGMSAFVEKRAGCGRAADGPPPPAPRTKRGRGWMARIGFIGLGNMGGGMALESRAGGARGGGLRPCRAGAGPGGRGRLPARGLGGRGGADADGGHHHAARRAACRRDIYRRTSPRLRHLERC